MDHNKFFEKFMDDPIFSRLWMAPQTDFQRIMNGPHVSIRNDKKFEMTCGTPKAIPRPAPAALAGKNPS